MGVVTAIRDGLQSMVANLATARDKAASVYYAEPTLDDDQIINSYRGSWLARNIIDIPADDTCREWREWKADANQIEAIEKEEKRLDVKGKVREARKLARLWGGAAIYVSIKGQNPAEPFDPSTVKKGAIDQLTVLTRHDVVPTEIDTDPMSEFFGKPKAYMLANVTGSFANTAIHPSRLVIFNGNAIPVRGNAAVLTRYWGDSVLVAVMDAVKHAEGTAANIASLIFEAKIDVISVEGLMARANDQRFIDTIKERFSLAATTKGNNGTLILDKGEDYQQKTVSFATLPDILNSFLQIASGASRIPATLLIGQAPQGMNATGEGDYRNYLDRIKAEQDLEMSPAMMRLDETLIYSALGNRPEEIWYDWSPIWTEPPKARAETFKAMADAARALAGGTGQQPIMPVEALSDAMVNALIESGILPGLEAAIEEYGSLAEQEPSEEELAAAAALERAAKPDPKQIAKDAAPRTLYVRRDVINRAEIVRWAKSQGFTDIVPDLHVTIAYSRTPVDWFKVGQSWSEKLDIAAGGPRQMARLGDSGKYIALLITANELVWRNKEIREAGASWDWPDYQPHISIQIGGEVDLSKVEPYQGKIVLGAEMFEEVKQD